MAEALRQDQLAATAYDQYRDGVSASTRKLLPTSAQIVGLFKTWEGALEAAELAPVATPQPFGLPIVEAIGLFVRTQGWLPSRGELERFAADKRWTFPIQSTSRKPWRAWIADFESWWIGDVGQQMPDRSPFRSEFIPLTETEINALPTTARVRKGHWTRDRVIDCVIAYLTDNPSVKSLQQRPYRAWANQRNASGTATASTSTLTRYGTLRELELAARRAIDTTP